MASTYEELIAKSRELAASGDMDNARRVAEIAIKRRDSAPPAPDTNMVEQSMSGVNEGIAAFAGFPVDTVNGLLSRSKAESEPGLDFDERGIPSPKPVTITNDNSIEEPFGGGQTFRNLLSPTISETQPQTTAQRYGRRIGQEVGFGVPAALTGASLSTFGAPARASMPSYMGTSAAGDVGAAVAGQTSQEIAPGNQTADFIASLLGGGGSSLAASRTTPALAPTPSFDDVKARAQRQWDTVARDTSTLTDSATDGLKAATRNQLPTGQLATNSYPNAFGAADDIDTLMNPRIQEVEDARRIVGDRVASDPKESRIGVGMKKEIEKYLNGLTANDVNGANPEEAIEALSGARRSTHQIKKAEAVMNKEMRGETRAETTGSGGNEVNAKRQNIRTIFDKERDPTLSGKRAGYTPDEMSAMGDVVSGTTGSNVARNLGKLSPSSGMLSMATTGLGGASGATAAMMGGSPLLAIPAAAGGVGMLAKAAAESMTKAQIEKLLATILNGGKTPGQSVQRGASKRAIIEQMISGSAAQ